MTETPRGPMLDLCFYDVMMTLKGERGPAAFSTVGDLLVKAGVVAGQYKPLDERGVTALNYLVLGTPENKAVMADDEGRLANTVDLKELLTKTARAAGAEIVYVTKLTDDVEDFEEFADIENADAARDLVFRQARSVAVGRVTPQWVRELAAATGQDVHVLKRDAQSTALVDGGLDISRLPTMDPKSAFVYTTPLAMLVRIFLPGRSLGETVHEVNFTWFAPTTPLRSFAPGSEVSRYWNETVSGLQAADFLASELNQNPEAKTPTDAVELWSSEADLAVVESVLTAAGLPGRAVRMTQHEGRAENLPGVTTVRADSQEVLDVSEASGYEPKQTAPSVVEVQENRPLAAIARVSVALLISVVCLWLALAVFDSLPRIGMTALAFVFLVIAGSLGWKAYREFGTRRD